MFADPADEKSPFSWYCEPFRNCKPLANSGMGIRLQDAHGWERESGLVEDTASHQSAGLSGDRHRLAPGGNNILD